MSDYNFLSSNGFTFELVRAKNVAFTVQSVQLPELTVPGVSSDYPGGLQRFNGSALEQGDLSIEFIVDENLNNYEEIFRWITQQRFPSSEFTPRNEFEQYLTSDALLITMNNNSNPNRIFTFKDCFPVALSGINFSSNSGNVVSATCTATFQYSYFTLT